MNRADFMDQLESLLQSIAPTEREEAIQYYNDYFDDAGKENEREVIEALGNPARVAENIKRDLLGNGYGDKPVRKAQASDRALMEYGKEEQDGDGALARTASAMLPVPTDRMPEMSCQAAARKAQALRQPTARAAGARRQAAAREAEPARQATARTAEPAPRRAPPSRHGAPLAHMETAARILPRGKMTTDGAMIRPVGLRICPKNPRRAKCRFGP